MNDDISIIFWIIIFAGGFILWVIIIILQACNYFNSKKARLSSDRIEQLKPKEVEIREAILKFDSILNQEEYINNKKYQIWINDSAFISNFISNCNFDIDNSDNFQQSIYKLADYFFNGRVHIDNHNEIFIKKEMPIAKEILDNLGIKNNEEQLRAIVCNEDSNLIVAGAGTGKTTTIVGKVGYLINRKNIRPEEILLLVFGEKASHELEQRIVDKFGDLLRVSTFHKFGKDIIGNVDDRSPDIAFESDTDLFRFLDENFNILLNSNNQYLELAIEYFAYYLNEIELIPSFSTLDDYYKYRKSQKILTILKERVKSHQEAEIANFLYRHNINYVYEKPYKLDTSNSKYRQYHPDFYLPDYDVYIEHFGIDRQGKTASNNENESRKYLESIEWKNNLHRQNGTNLIATFSYEFQEKKWKELLFAKLANFNVTISKKSPEEVLEKLKEGKDIKEMSLVFRTFLNLLKSGGYILDELIAQSKSSKNIRYYVFLELFKPIYQIYEKHLADNEQIDFNDMLIDAADHLNKNNYKTQYKYILVDEFQDTSISRFNLLKAILIQNQDSKTFAVGDDWQSIFRFAGADVSLMTDFEKYFGFTKVNKLETTHRFSEEAANITNEFIQKNTYQIKKEVKSSWNLNSKPFQIFYKENKDDAILEKTLNELNQNAIQNNRKYEVFLLGRYTRNKPKNLYFLEKIYSSLYIKFLTVHKVKGKEADFVIILDVVSGRYGFPSEIADDPVLNMVLSKSDTYQFSEERRVMYVALTRARYKTFIITDKMFKSFFINEIESYDNDQLVKCPVCTGKLIIAESKFGGLWERCSNYPYCEYYLNHSTKSITDLTINSQPTIPVINQYSEHYTQYTDLDIENINQELYSAIESDSSIDASDNKNNEIGEYLNNQDNIEKILELSDNYLKIAPEYTCYVSDEYYKESYKLTNLGQYHEAINILNKAIGVKLSLLNLYKNNLPDYVPSDYDEGDYGNNSEDDYSSELEDYNEDGEYVGEDERLEEMAREDLRQQIENYYNKDDDEDYYNKDED